MGAVEALRAEMLYIASRGQPDVERVIRRDEAQAIRTLLRQANSYREAMELLDKHINAL